MAKREILAGATDQTIDVFILDTASTTGGGKTGIAFNTSGLTCYYRKGATGAATQLTLATQTVGGAHSDGGFVEIDAVNMPGVYRLDLSDAMVNTAGMLTIFLRGASGMAPVAIEIEVVSVNKYDSVRMGLTALPNAAADAAGGLPISDAGGLDLDARLDAAISSRASQASVDVVDGVVDAILVDTNELQTDWANGGRLDLILDARAAQTTVDAILVDTGTTLQAELDYIQSVVDAIVADTGELQVDWADGGRLDLILDARASQVTADAILTDTGTDIPASIAAIQADTNDIQTRLPAALVSGRIDANIGASAITGFDRAMKAIITGTVGPGATTTTIPLSAASPSAGEVDCWKGLVLRFNSDTTTAGLRSQATTITANTAGATPTITVEALTTAPASGDLLTIQ